MQYMRTKLKRPKYSSPAWTNIYHKYGLKYFAIFLVLSAYSFLGAGVFLFFEKPAELARLYKRQKLFEDIRHGLVRQSLDDLFNDTERPLIFVDASQMEAISRTFDSGLRIFENIIADYSKHNMEPILKWDLWTALIYAWTVITTIGYGHLFPLTPGGRLATMLYAVFGIPLMLTALSSVGKLLTKGMKYPFFIVKRFGRRLFRYCTKMTREEISKADEKDKSTLEIFDLPIPVAIILVMGWIFICSAITLIWEKDWNYFVAFYFFFISLSTIGFGDVVPSRPYYLLVMFGNTMIGMALLSMLLNLIQSKLEPITIAEEPDPFENERNGLRRALKRASIFINTPWLSTEPQKNRSVVVSIQETEVKKIDSDQTATVIGSVKVAPSRKNLIRRKSKQDATTAGGAAVSALSTFLAPLFSTSLEKPIDKKIEEVEKNLEASDQLATIDETKIDQNQVKEENSTSNPLRKTVSFKGNELVQENLQKSNQSIDHENQVDENRLKNQVVLASKTAGSKAIATIENGKRPSSVRIRRISDEKSKKKKLRTASMRDDLRSRMKRTSERNEDEKSEGQKMSSTEKFLIEFNHSRKTAQQSPRESQTKKIDFTDQDIPKIAERKSSKSILRSPEKNSTISKKSDFSTEAIESKKKRVRRTQTTPQVISNHSMITLDNKRESHSTCSICAYHSLISDLPETNFDTRKGDGKKRRPKIDHSKNFSGYSIDQIDRSANQCDRGISQSNFNEQSVQTNHPEIDYLSQINISTDNTDPITFVDQRAKITPNMANASDQSIDNLPNDEADLFAYLDEAIRTPRKIVSPKYRHSISADVISEPIENRSRFKMPQSYSDHGYLCDRSMRSIDTQTMISFPSQDSDSRISISADRGAVHLLPENVSITEINRLVNLNINTEILNNELEALAGRKSNESIDISAYQHVLSLQDLVDQMNHEASLPRSLSQR